MPCPLATIFGEDEMDKRNQKLLLAGALGLAGGVAAATWMSRSARTQKGTRGAGLPTASVLDTLALAVDVLAPTFAKGVIVRRPKVVALAEKLELDRRAVRRMQKLRDKYGSGPLMLPLPIRKQAVVLAPEHVRRILDGAPQPFSPASSEKRAALSHFEPDAALISQGPERAERRRFNEEVLEHTCPVHPMASSFMPLVEEEANGILAAARAAGELDWDTFNAHWTRLGRRVFFGEVAADDQELSDMIIRLRRAANWAFLHPKQTGLRTRFLARIQSYLDRAEPGSLAAKAAGVPKNADTKPNHQVPQWLFAFDAAGMATFRALALLAAHPDQAAQARAELHSKPGAGRAYLPLLRATILESLRLWPTTPAILRQSTHATEWDGGTMPAGTGVLLFTPFFHRDDARMACADRFTPELWRKDDKVRDAQDRDWPLIPFSSGPAMCPARHLVLMLTSVMLGTLIDDDVDGARLRLVQQGRLNPARLPGTLDNYSLRFTFAPETSGTGTRR
jgi:hypothetical protein